MDPGIASALITGAITVTIAGGGGTFAWVRARFRAKDTEKEKA